MGVISLGDNTIREKRVSLGYSQEEIARKLDISLRNYQYIENHKVEPSVITALKLCRILNVDPYEAFTLN